MHAGPDGKYAHAHCIATEYFFTDICLISFHCSAGDVGRDSVGGTATGYELDGQEIESWWGGGPPSLLYNGYRVSLPGGGGLNGLGVVLTTNTHIGVRLKKE